MSLSDFSLQSGWRQARLAKAFALGFAEAGADVAITDVAVADGHLDAVGEQIGCASLFRM